MMFWLIMQRSRMLYTSLSNLDVEQAEIETSDNSNVSTDVGRLQESIMKASDTNALLFSSSDEDE